MSAVFWVVCNAVEERLNRQLADTDAVNRHEHRESASITTATQQFTVVRRPFFKDDPEGQTILDFLKQR